ncbi:general secretion pathway protein D [Desulfarculus baarsii DSM 2075]|uniref:General secretion pathway protein D n=1 Tax=Desulfarculus baarsii (strain ATCC 33931 / DSM 2075 / LMG 7858 / VKM B-1802 / 2st14) TaxID=644282 RepID=E1QGM3_DESB2|nr:type II secretion system secretin GspD [Desulfarculus baarsii]ADK84716.1 general secretion pathway protein D [Desulfarculus baarsii DSM 2075]
MTKRSHIVLAMVLGLALLAAAGCAGDGAAPARQNDSLWRIPPSERPKTSAANRDELLLEERRAQRPSQIGPEISSPLSGVAGPAPRGQDEAAAEDGQSHIINFNQAPLDEVIRVFADLTGATIITPAQIRGTVTISSGRRIPQSGLLPLLEAMLETNGYALLREGDSFRVSSLASARKGPTQIMLADRLAQAGPDGYAINVYYLRHIAASDAAKALEPFVSEGGRITAVMPANLLVVADTAPNQAKVAELSRMLDVPAVNRVGIRLYPIRNVDVGRLSAELQSIFGAMGISSKPASGMWAQIIALPQLSSIAVVSTYQHMFKRVDQWLEELDRQISDAETGIYVYYCQNGDATVIAEVLSGLFDGQEGEEAKSRPQEQEQQFQSQPASLTEDRRRSGDRAERRYTGDRLNRDQREDPRELEAERPQERTFSRRLEKSIRIVVDRHTNSIVLRAPRRDLKYLLKTLHKLDVFPKQVLIEVVIAEVTLDDQLKLGVEWRYLTENGATFSDINLKPDADLLPTSGLVYTIAKTNELLFTLKALAQKDKLQVISSPLLLAAENQSARILVGREIPIITDLTTSEDISTSTGNKVVDRSIEYRDVGIILTVTPRINDSGVVRLNIRQEVSDVLTDSFGDTGSPAFSQRTATTNVVTTDGQSIVLAGLIQETKHKIDSGVPFLSDVPILGYLFKTEKDVDSRTELILTITPHVIHDMNDARHIVQSLREQERFSRQMAAPPPSRQQPGDGLD